MRPKRSSYPAYKPSGADWLGAIPTHWELLQIKRLSPVKRGASPRPIDDPNYFDDKGEYSWVRISDVTSSKRYLEETTQRLSSLGKSLSVPLKPGALFLSIAGSVGKPIITRINCCIHDGFVYFPQFEGNPEFLYYIFASGQPYGGLGKLGTQLNLNTDTVGAIHIGYPSYEEQREIVTYLDCETTRIDTLIEKKQRQIELLQEKRTALISHAVTKGLNPNAKMKDSGVEWLGEIPAHWEVKRVKRLGDIRYGLGEPPEYVDDGLPFIRATDIRLGKIDLDTVKKVRPDDVPWSRNPSLVLYEILVVRSGAYTGDSALVTENAVGAIAGYDMVLTVSKAYAPFVAWTLLSKYMLQGQIYLERLRAAQPHLNAEELGGFVVVTPPYAEQRAIAAFLDRETAHIDALTEKVEKSITLLREYRTSLISAAVTGKIDVRKETTG